MCTLCNLLFFLYLPALLWFRSKWRGWYYVIHDRIVLWKIKQLFGRPPCVLLSLNRILRVTRKSSFKHLEQSFLFLFFHFRDLGKSLKYGLEFLLSYLLLFSDASIGAKWTEQAMRESGIYRFGPLKRLRLKWILLGGILLF